MEVNVVIEFFFKQKTAYEIDHKTGKVYVDRFLYAAAHYPFNYGFIEGTVAPDGDPLDCLVISREAVMPGTIIKSKPIGALKTVDEKGEDVKIIAVPFGNVDPFYSDIDNLDQVTKSIKNEIEHFFNHYKELEPDKFVKVIGWLDKKDAESVIKNCSVARIGK